MIFLAVFHNKVIQNLYQNDDSADEETIEKPSEEFIVNTVLTKRKVALQQDTSDVGRSRCDNIILIGLNVVVQPRK